MISHQSYERFDLICTAEGCSHRINVLNPQAFLENDLVLLQKLTDHEFTPSPLQSERLCVMLGGHEFLCPTHGNTHLDFDIFFKITVEDDFVIDLDDQPKPQKPHDDSIIGFIIDLL